MIGTTISHYEITAELGRGGMGVVYKAHDSRLNRDVALKFLVDHLIPDKDSHDRFMQEAKAAAALSHANICTLYDIGNDEGKLFLVMEFVEGQSLKEVIAEGSFPLENVRTIASQIAQGLKRAHETGIVHRDIKPANIMVTPRGEVKIMDFGLAKLSGGMDLTKTGSTIGTALYMSPEQARGEVLDAASDVWSLGVVLYEMLAGKRPFDGAYDAALIYGILNMEPEPPVDAPDDLAALTTQLLQKDASLRPSSDEIAAVLQGTATGISAPSRVSENAPKTTEPSAPSFAISKRLIGLIVGFLAIALAVWLFASSSPDPIDQDAFSIAVIPFGDLNPDKASNYLGDGMAESLISMLTVIDGIQIPPISTTRLFRGSTESIGDIGADLRSRYLIQGSIQNIGERVRLTVYLSDTQSEHELWRDQIDANLDDLFELQDSVTAAVSRVLQDEFEIGSSSAQFVMAGTNSSSAYDFYLRGRYLYQSRNQVSAVAMYDSSLVHDPDFVEAMIRKAFALTSMAGIGLVPFGEVFDEGIRLAERARELEPHNPRALMALASLYGFNLEFERALDLGGQSYRQDSLDTESILRYTTILRAAGHIETTHRLIERAVQMDPLDLSLTFSYAGLAAHLGFLDEARQSVENGLNLDSTDIPLRVRLAEIEALSGDYAAAIEIVEPLAEAMQDPLFVYFLAAFHGRLGNLEELIRWDNTLKNQDGFVSRSILSDFASYRGETEEAMALITQAVVDREPWASIAGLGISPIEVLNSAYFANANALIRPDNPWKIAEFDHNGVILNAHEIQLAAEAIDGKQ